MQPFYIYTFSRKPISFKSITAFFFSEQHQPLKGKCLASCDPKYTQKKREGNEIYLYIFMCIIW